MLVSVNLKTIIIETSYGGKTYKYYRKIDYYLSLGLKSNINLKRANIQNYNV